jgi:hypothetical protein
VQTLCSLAALTDLYITSCPDVTAAGKQALRTVIPKLKNHDNDAHYKSFTSHCRAQGATSCRQKVKQSRTAEAGSVIHGRFESSRVNLTCAKWLAHARRPSSAAIFSTRCASLCAPPSHSDRAVSTQKALNAFPSLDSETFGPPEGSLLGARDA